jgi:enoyl-CoA hydratase/carnithine racemase
MDTNGFTIARDGAVATLTLAKPDTGNRLAIEEVQALGRAIRAAGEDPGVKAVAICAAGDAFCLGRLPPSGGSRRDRRWRSARA